MSATIKVAELRDAFSRFGLKSMVTVNALAEVKVEDGKLVFASPRVACRVSFDGDLAGSVKLNARMLSRYAKLLPDTETVDVSLEDGCLVVGGTTFTREKN